MQSVKRMANRNAFDIVTSLFSANFIAIASARNCADGSQELN
jgi:hypothetical protein